MLTGDDIAVRFRSLQLEIVAALNQMDTKAIFNRKYHLLLSLIYLRSLDDERS